MRVFARRSLVALGMKRQMEKELLHTKQLLKFQPKTSITIISNGRVLHIDFAAITHISKYGSLTIIHTITDTCKTHLPLQDILKDLPVNYFFRVHRSHIVSLNRIRGAAKNKIKIADHNLPLTNYYKIQLLARLREVLDNQYTFSEKL